MGEVLERLADEEDLRESCRVCGVEICYAELCAACAKDNQPFGYSKYRRAKTRNFRVKLKPSNY